MSLCSVFGMLNSHRTDVLLEMKSFPFQFIRLRQSFFCFGLRLLLPSMFLMALRLQWQNCQQFIREANPFRCCVQVSRLFSDLLPSLFPCRYPFDPQSRFGHQIDNQHVGQFSYKLATFTVMTSLLDLQRSK